MGTLALTAEERINVSPAAVFDLFGTLTRRVARCLPDVPGLADLAAAAHRTTDWADLDEAVSVFFEAVGDAGRYVLLVLDQFDRRCVRLGGVYADQLCGKERMELVDFDSHGSLSIM